MNKQLTFSLISDELAQARTSKKEFLEKIERIIPFDEWIGIIRPCYYKGERGNKPYDLELMLRIFLLQNLYDLSDMKVMNEVIDSRAFSDFCGVDSSYQVPDGDTIGRIRNILVMKKLSKSGQYAAKKAEHKKSSVRAKVEHVFAVVKRLFGYRKTRYRGLRKQTAKLNIMFALANLYLADRKSLTA